MSPAAAWIEALTAATLTAEQAEAACRAEYQRRLDALAQERAFAFRRANLLRAVAEVVAQAPDAEAAVAFGLTTLRHRLGWEDESAAREELIQRFAPVCAALWDPPEDARPADPPADPAAALAAFEAWHEEARGASFWMLFERWMPETPVVDF